MFVILRVRLIDTSDPCKIPPTPHPSHVSLSADVMKKQTRRGIEGRDELNFCSLPRVTGDEMAFSIARLHTNP
jgi:hypothetical protein